MNKFRLAQMPEMSDLNCSHATQQNASRQDK